MTTYVDAGIGEKYAEMLALAYRQVIAAHKLVMLCAPVGALLTAATLLFAKKLALGAMNSGFIKD